jgi:hypothetical protein
MCTSRRPAMDLPWTWRRPPVELVAIRPLGRRPQAPAGGRAPASQAEIKSAAGLLISSPGDAAGPREVHPWSMPCGTRATRQPRSPHIPRPRCEGQDAGDDRGSQAHAACLVTPEPGVKGLSFSHTHARPWRADLQDGRAHLIPHDMPGGPGRHPRLHQSPRSR